MGAMNCGRCDQPMCKILIEGETYICNECLDELRGIRKFWDDNLTHWQVREKINIFMQTTKGDFLEIGTDEALKKFIPGW